MPYKAINEIFGNKHQKEIYQSIDVYEIDLSPDEYNLYVSYLEMEVWCVCKYKDGRLTINKNDWVSIVKAHREVSQCRYIEPMDLIKCIEVMNQVCSYNNSTLFDPCIDITFNYLHVQFSRECSSNTILRLENGLLCIEVNDLFRDVKIPFRNMIDYTNWLTDPFPINDDRSMGRRFCNFLGSNKNLFEWKHERNYVIEDFQALKIIDAHPILNKFFINGITSSSLTEIYSELKKYELEQRRLLFDNNIKYAERLLLSPLIKIIFDYLK